MNEIYASKINVLNIGFMGEDNRTRVHFPVGDLQAEYPGCAFVLLVKRAGDNSVYVVEPVISGDEALWTVEDGFLANKGEGEAVLICSTGAVTAKRKAWKTWTDYSLTGGVTPPSDFSTWVTELLQAGADVQAAVDAFNEITAEATEGEQTSAYIDWTGDHPVLRIVIHSGGGGSVTVDDELSDTSTNPVQNKVVKAALDQKADEEDLSSLSETIVELGNAVDALPQKRESTDIGSDLDISDESGHVLMRLADGEVKTKEFDSSKAAKMQNSIDSSADMDLVDPAGNVVLRVQDGHIQTKNFNSRTINPKVITLKADGTGDFSTLKAALESITDADPDENTYEIHVYPGTYDTLEGYTEEQIESADIGGGYTDNSFVGAKLTDGISLIGIGNRENIILTAELATADYDIDIRGNISTLNLQGSGRVENVSIHAENLRYCIHDDFGCDHIVRRTLKNVVFSGSNLSYDPFTSYGSGIPYGGMVGLFEDCDFGFNFGMHTRQLMKVCSVVELRNCSGHQVILGDNANDNDAASHQFILNGCSFDSLKVSRTNGTTTPHMFISGTSRDMMVFEPGIYIVQTGEIVKTALTALDEGTLVAFATGAEKLTKAASAAVAYGVIVKKDTEYDYVQKSGYINAAWVGLTGLSIGDYIKVNSDMELVTGGTSSDAVGVVVYTNSSTAIIKML